MLFERIIFCFYFVGIYKTTWIFFFFAFRCSFISVRFLAKYQRLITLKEEEETKTKKKRTKTLASPHWKYILVRKYEICSKIFKKKKETTKKNTYISVSFVDSLSHSIMVSLITFTQHIQHWHKKPFPIQRREKIPQMTFAKFQSNKSERE